MNVNLERNWWLVALGGLAGILFELVATTTQPVT
jgi:hypothetical protein